MARVKLAIGFVENNVPAKKVQLTTPIPDASVTWLQAFRAELFRQFAPDGGDHIEADVPRVKISLWIIPVYIKVTLCMWFDVEA